MPTHSSWIKGEDIQSLHFQWTAIQAKIERSEKLIREFRLTSLAMFVFLFAVSVFSQKPSATQNILVSFAAVWWGMSYIMTLYPFMIFMSKMDINFKYFAPGINRDELPGVSPEERAYVVEEARYWAMHVHRQSRMTSLFVVTGIFMTILGIAFLSLQSRFH